MVRAMEQEHDGFRSKFFHFRGTQENNTGRHAKSLSVESANMLDSTVDDDLASSRSQGSTPVRNSSTEKQHAGLLLVASNRPEKALKLKLSSMDDDDTAVFPPLQDVGHAVLESYSRILESLAFTVMSRIEDVLHADGLTQNPTQTAPRRKPTSETPPEKSPHKREEANNNGPETPVSMTLLDFMGWGQEQSEAEPKKGSFGHSDDLNADSDLKQANKPGNIVTNKRVSYLENLSAVRSPTSRH